MLPNLSLERGTPTLSPGELQRLRLATQVRSNLFGVVFVLDEPSAGLHPADTEALPVALDQLKQSGHSIFVVEHEIDVIRHADWIVDVGPDAGQHGGRILYSGPLDGLRRVPESRTRPFVFNEQPPAPRTPRAPAHWLTLSGVTWNNLRDLAAKFPLGTLTSVTGVSGSGQSSLVSQVLVGLIADRLGHLAEVEGDDELEDHRTDVPAGHLVEGIRRVSMSVRGRPFRPRTLRLVRRQLNCAGRGVAPPDR